MAEMERQAQDRKDHGMADSPSTRSTSRGPSLDNALSPTSTRSPSLGMVPEDDQFAIGDDDDDEDIGDMARPTSLSEKARGKQPEPTSRASSISRNVSTSSLQSLVITTSMGAGFRPTQPWLDSWYSRLPLNPIFQVIEAAEKKQKQKSRTAESIGTSIDDARSGSQDVSREDATPGKYHSFAHHAFAQLIETPRNSRLKTINSNELPVDSCSYWLVHCSAVE